MMAMMVLNLQIRKQRAIRSSNMSEVKVENKKMDPGK